MSLSWNPSSSADFTCDLCGDTATKTPVVDVFSPDLHFFRCEACGSLTCHPYVFPKYEEDYGVTNYAQFYCEQGAGIDYMAEPITRITGIRDVKTYLDLGCGFGFTLDLARRIFDLEAIGVDPSSYSRVGERMLGVKIYPDYLENVTELAGRTFDIVMASEVIEHVNSPRGLVKTMVEALSPSGVLVLTSPSADFINPSHPDTDVREALAPPFHFHLLSPRSLEAILREHGMTHVEMFLAGHRMVAYASREPLDGIREIADPIPKFLAYLRTVVDEAEAAKRHDEIVRGYAYRLLNGYANRGDWVPAKAAWKSWEQAALSAFPDTPLEPGALVERIRRAIVDERCDFGELGNLIPYNTPCAFYFRGTMAMLNDGDPKLAGQYLEAAATLAELILEYYAQFGHFLLENQTHFWQMRFMAGIALRNSGQLEASRDQLKAVLGAQPRPGFRPPTEDLLHRARIELGCTYAVLVQPALAAPLLLDAINEIDAYTDPGYKAMAAELLGWALGALSKTIPKPIESDPVALKAYQGAYMSQLPYQVRLAMKTTKTFR